jgi:hypothetical protein
MSLHTLAKKVQQTGRGQDSMLVHMSPREVQGLQALAKVKGGQLTTNPKTGLPEAGFLEDILPMVAAGAAIYFTAGAATPFVASATGLGATGAGILAGAGAGALIGGGMSAIQGGDVGKGALMGGLGGAISGGMGAPGEVPGPETVNTGVGLNPNASVNLNANIPVQASNNLLTAPSQINPSTGQLIDPMKAGFTGAPVPSGGYSGFTGGQAVPGPNTLTSTLTPTANYVNSALPGQSVLPGANPNLASAPSVSGSVPGAPSVKAPTPTPSDASWWGKQSPWEKAGYTTAGAALLAEMTAQNQNNAGNAPDSSDDGNYLARISPNFQAQAPVQPNPYYQAQYPNYQLRRTQFAAQGGLMSLAEGGSPVEQMSRNVMGGQGNMFPLSQQEHTNFATPTQMPASAEVIRSDYDVKTDPYRGVMMAGGGIASLGGYSDGGRLLKGPGDGMSDHIPAQIGNKQPARLADGEFVVPADVVSHLGNGSTDAGAKRLYSMMDKVRQARTGKKKQAPAVNINKYLPA